MKAELDIDAQGHVKDVRGDPAFGEFWTDVKKSENGFLGIVFPESPVAVGDSWSAGIVGIS